MATDIAASFAAAGIQPDCLYTFDQVLRVAGWGKESLKMAREAGLPVRFCHRRGYVLGKDLIAYIQERGSESYS